MTRFGAVLSALFLCLLGSAGNVAAERLVDALRYALHHHPEVQVAAANLRGAREGYAQASAGLLPVVDLRVGSGREESENAATRSASGNTRTLNRQEAGVTLRQNVYDGDQVRSDMERQTYRVESASARLSESAEQIAFRVVEVYLDALRDAELIRLAVENVTRHEAVLEKTRLRFSSGVGQRADVEQANARLAQAQATLISARGNAEDSAARYQRLVGRAYDRLFMPDSPERAIPSTLVAAQDLGREYSHSLKAARAEVSAAQATVRTVRADLLPRLDVELAANRNRDVDGVTGPSNDLSAMLVMRYNLFRGGGDQARVREAREREHAAVATATNALEFTEESVTRSWVARTTTTHRLAPLESHVRASEQVLEAYRDQFGLGRRSLLDVLNAGNELFQSSAALSSGRISARGSEFRLLASMGILVQSMGLSSELLKLGEGAAAERDKLPTGKTTADDAK